MDGVLLFVLLLVAVVAFDLMALLGGVDSRDALPDDHHR